MFSITKSIIEIMATLFYDDDDTDGALEVQKTKRWEITMDDSLCFAMWDINSSNYNYNTLSKGILHMDKHIKK